MYQGGRRRGSSKDYLRSCDFCGRLVLRSTMVKKDYLLACKDDAPGRERLTLDKANAKNVTPQTWKPAKSVKGDSEIDVYQADEAVAFNAIAVDGCFGLDGVFRQGWAPYEFIDTSGPGEGQPIADPTGLTETPRCAGWSIDYLYKILVENKRPGTWLTNATRKIGELGTWLLAHQFSGTATTTVYGGFPRNGQAGSTATIYAEDQGVGLLGLVRAFQVTGNISYLLGARKAATCLRRMQCGGLRTSTYLVVNTGGGRFQPGPFSTSITGTSPFTTTTTHSTDFYAGDLIAAEALNALKTVDGDSTYGDSTAVGEFAQATSATLSTMISQALDWWRTGAPDENNTIVVGLSSTTPWELYRVSTSVAAQMPEWRYKWSSDTNGYLTSLNVAKALRAIYAVSGVTAQVSAVYSWLRALTSPAAFLVPSSFGIWEDRTTLGTFDSSIAPPTEIAIPLTGGAAVVGAYYYMTTGGGIATSSTELLPGPSYDFAAEGMLSEVQAAIGTPTFTKTKDRISPLRPRTWLRREQTAP